MIGDNCQEMTAEDGLLQNGTVYALSANVMRIILNYWLYSFVVCSIISVVGNILVIMIVYRNKTLHTTPNYFIATMAVSDLIMPLNSSFLLITFLNDGGGLSQTFYTTFCKLDFFFVNISHGVSMNSLVVITVHRFYAVVYPMKARLERKKLRRVLLAVSWLMPMILFFPLLQATDFHLDSYSCQIDILSSKTYLILYYIILLIIFVAVPLATMLILYTVIVVKLTKQKIPGNSSSHVIRRRQQNVRLTKMFLTVVFLFIVTVFLYHVVEIVTSTSGASDWRGWLVAKYIVTPFPLMFHALNPVIYFIFCSSYRQGVEQIFCRCYCCLVANRACGQNVAPVIEQIELKSVSRMTNITNN